MRNFFLKKPWHLKDNIITPEKIWFDRRKIIKNLFFGISISPLINLNVLSNEEFTENFFRNSKYKVGRKITSEKYSTTYNNFYEFGSSKNIWRSAQNLNLNPWLINIDGLVKKPLTIDFDDLLKKVSGLEERIYRHRCVEAWAMTVPWLGFPLKKIIDLVEPNTSAKYLKMQTFFDPKIARGQSQSWYPWPYTESITLKEAFNELAFIAIGLYGKQIPKQNGAPLRLVLPWKYGFKSIKSIVKFTFTENKPTSFWTDLQPNEYGFWANVNPKFDHPRWSQKYEILIGEEPKRVKTQIYNGYGEYVSTMYPDDVNYKREYFF